MSTCPSCGHADAHEHDFCEGCGNYLRWEQAPEQSDTAVLKAVTLRPETLASFAEPAPVSSLFDQSEVGTFEAGREAVRGDAAVVTLRLLEDAGSAGGPATATVDAGGDVELLATVRNESGIVDDYDLRVTGIPEEWWTISPPVVYLVPFGAESGSYEQEVTVRLHPPRRPEAQARLWPIRVVATSRAHNTEAGSAGAGLVIAAYGEIESRVTPERGHGERSARYTLPVRSGANAPLVVSFRGEDADGEMSFEFDPPTLTIPPGGEGTSTVTVSAERSVRGSEREREFTVYAKSGEQVLAATAVFVQRPTVTRERLGLWRVLLTLLAAAMLVGGSFMNWSDHPHSELENLRGVCVTGDPSGCLRFDHYLRVIDVDLGLEHPTAGDDRLVLLNMVTSLGFLPILLGLAALVGIRRGRMAWMAGTVAVIALLVFLVTLRGVEAKSGAGAWVVLLGGLLALAAGALKTASRKGG